RSERGLISCHGWRKRRQPSRELVVQRWISQKIVRHRSGKNVGENSNSATHHGVGPHASRRPCKTQTRLPNNVGCVNQRLPQSRLDGLVVGFVGIVGNGSEGPVKSREAVGHANWIGVVLGPQCQRDLQVWPCREIVLRVQTQSVKRDWFGRSGRE